MEIKNQKNKKKKNEEIKQTNISSGSAFLNPKLSQINSNKFHLRCDTALVQHFLGLFIQFLFFFLFFLCNIDWSWYITTMLCYTQFFVV